MDDEQHAYFGVIVLIDDGERRAGNRIVMELAARITEAVLRVLGEIGIDDAIKDLQFLSDDTKAELRQP